MAQAMCLANPMSVCGRTHVARVSKEQARRRSALPVTPDGPRFRDPCDQAAQVEGPGQCPGPGAVAAAGIQRGPAREEKFKAIDRLELRTRYVDAIGT